MKAQYKAEGKGKNQDLLSGLLDTAGDVIGKFTGKGDEGEGVAAMGGVGDFSSDVRGFSNAFGGGSGLSQSIEDLPRDAKEGEQNEENVENVRTASEVAQDAKNWFDKLIDKIADIFDTPR